MAEEKKDRTETGMPTDKQSSRQAYYEASTTNISEDITFYVERLCRTMETMVGKKISSPADFEELAEQIRLRTHEVIGVNTLKRMFGHANYEVVTPRRSTLDILSRFVGYSGFNAFIMTDGITSSDVVHKRHVMTKHLASGLHIELTWLPDRRVVVEHLGNARFVVREVENSKLAVGDTFMCSLIVEGEPLFLTNLCHKGAAPVAYEASRRGGLHFKIIED